MYFTCRMNVSWIWKRQLKECVAMTRHFHTSLNPSIFLTSGDALKQWRNSLTFRNKTASVWYSNVLPEPHAPWREGVHCMGCGWSCRPGKIDLNCTNAHTRKVLVCCALFLSVSQFSLEQELVQCEQSARDCLVLFCAIRTHFNSSSFAWRPNGLPNCIPV